MTRNAPLEAETVFYYEPAVIGEHILEFDIATAETSVKARAYMDIVKRSPSRVRSKDASHSEGSENTTYKGETVTLELVNEDLFNFEVAGWYDAEGRLISADATCPLEMNLYSLTDFEVKLKPRTVNISRDGTQTVEFTYLIQQNGKPVAKKGVRLPDAIYRRLQGIRTHNVQIRRIPARQGKDPAAESEDARSADNP